MNDKNHLSETIQIALSALSNLQTCHELSKDQRAFLKVNRFRVWLTEYDKQINNNSNN